MQPAENAFSDPRFANMFTEVAACTEHMNEGIGRDGRHRVENRQAQAWHRCSSEDDKAEESEGMPLMHPIESRNELLAMTLAMVG